MKYETYSEYDPRHTALAESAFLTLWSTLGSWHADLVLVGGLVPKYLCGALTQHRSLPRPATLDVDLGIALATDSGQYGNLFWELSGQGFKRSAKHPGRLEKTIGDFPVYVDFLVEHPPRISGSAQVEDITASIMPGVDRALATARTVEVTGVDLHGADQKLTARVCEVGPFLALKLRAFCGRQQPKDAFDILYTLRHYDGGTTAAIAAFAEEVRVGNPACTDALRTLKEHFQTETSPGPVKASHFVFSQAQPGESEDTKFLRATLRQDMVDAATQLLKAATA
ncbi:MAG: hypothetical protein NTV80_26130 [Verrucomicrobia bacterium]|nr:hypothetical protein [Verrucomicrobiota bacterium]